MRENVSLKEYSTFKIGGIARFFCVAKDEEGAKAALDFAIKNKLKVFVIGKGSNLLISDRGWDGLVLKLEMNGMHIDAAADGYIVTLGCGAYLTKSILSLQKEGISGLEWAAGIPATLGGAVSNNAGAHGKDMGGSVKSVSVIEMRTSGEDGVLESYVMREMTGAECDFSYRDSIFKKTKKFVILGATLSLAKGDAAAMRDEISANMKNRTEKQPLEFPNVGSIFRNPVLSDASMEKFFRDNEDMRGVFKNNTIPAGWLIEQVGLKGKKVGSAMVSEKHANFIVNAGGATAEEVVIMISMIKQKVRESFGIQLLEEIEYVGFQVTHGR